MAGIGKIRRAGIMLAVSAVVLLSAGCDPSPPPPRVPVPAQGTAGPPRHDPVKPLPGDAAPTAPEASRLPPTAVSDPPIVRDRPPEQRAFVAAYNAVGRPRMAVFVNRRLDGSLIGIGDAEVAAGANRATTAPAVRQVEVAGPDNRIAPGSVAPSVTGIYDEAFARAMDYEAVENILMDWLAAAGNTEIISPTLTRARLTQPQLDALERGERGVLLDVTERLDVDILVLVQARPTRQTFRGLEVRLVAEAVNTRGGRSLGRAVVDTLPPLERSRIEESTRQVARKLMDDMVSTWTAPLPSPPATPPAATAPTP